MVCFCVCVSNWVYSSKTHQFPKRNEPKIWVWVQFSQFLLGPSPIWKIFMLSSCEKPPTWTFPSGKKKQRLVPATLPMESPPSWNFQLLASAMSIKTRGFHSGINCQPHLVQDFFPSTVCQLHHLGCHISHRCFSWFIQHEGLNFYESVSNSALEFIYLNPPVGCLNRPARVEIWWSTGCLGAFCWVDPTHYSWSVPPTALLVPVVSGCFQIANMTDWKMMKRCKANAWGS